MSCNLRVKKCTLWLLVVFERERVRYLGHTTKLVPNRFQTYRFFTIGCKEMFCSVSCRSLSSEQYALSKYIMGIYDRTRWENQMNFIPSGWHTVFIFPRKSLLAMFLNMTENRHVNFAKKHNIAFRWGSLRWNARNIKMFVLLFLIYIFRFKGSSISKWRMKAVELRVKFVNLFWLNKVGNATCVTENLSMFYNVLLVVYTR